MSATSALKRFMALAAGTRLGPYEILSPLGVGGMGEVYRARDTKLGRAVALKILPESFTHDPERLARFRREAQVLAALNHPHIGAIYGLDEANGQQFLVLELIDGETLADRIVKGPLPVDEALTIAQQIAEALDAAHEKGIIHRDLKPANIALTEDGQVKVLDFGLAKATAASGATLDVANSPTLTSPATMTGVGVILGTAAYMSPEQAKGRAADRRSDVWAFGCVVLEMLTGRKVFAGETISDTLAAVLKEEPNLTRAPARVRRLLHACLQKDPTLRLQAIGDARLLLEDAPKEAPGAMRRVPWAVAAAFAAMAALAFWALWRRPAPNPAQAAMRLDVDLGAAVAPTNLGPDAILSPDGTRLVFVAQGSNGKSRLLTRRLDQSEPVELRGSEGAFAPFFSPDGQGVAFFAGGKLKKTRVDTGGEPVVLCEAPAGRGGSWSEDGHIIAALDTRVGLSLVPSEGGRIVRLTTLAPGEISHRWPQVLLGGKKLLFMSSTTPANFDEASIRALSLVDHTGKIVLERAGMSPRYVPSGHLIYATKGTLFAVPFDPVSLETRGRPEAVVEDVSSDTTYGFSRFDFSASGMLLYRRGRTEGLRTVHWMDSAGRLESLQNEPAMYQFPRLSPDGSKLLWMVNQGPTADLWIYDWQRGGKTRLTDGKSVYIYPVWSPDGRYVVFSSSGGMFWTRADGAGKPQPLTASKALQSPASFTPDGKRLVFSELNPAGGLIQTVLLNGGSGQLHANTPELFLQTASAAPYPAFSSDGRWLAYADAESGSYEVYVRAFPDKGTRWLISNGGGTIPVWSKNGRELFYRTEDSRIMVTTYTVKGDTFVAGKPRVWSERRLANTGLTPNFDLAPDGKRFVVLMAPEGAEPTEVPSHVTLMMNFFDELRRIAPVTKQ
jgi:Tol biopolymer transport system component